MHFFFFWFSKIFEKNLKKPKNRPQGARGRGRGQIFFYPNFYYFFLARTGRKNIPKEEGEHSKNKHKENSEVAALRKKFEVEIEIEPESAQIARTKPRNRSTIWKKTNPIKVKNESSKNRQALSNNSPKSPSVKRLNQ